MNNSDNVLCISVAVGGGHTQAAKERIKQLRQAFPGIYIIERDLLINLVGPLFGITATKFMNLTLKKRWFRIRNLFFNGQPIADQIVLFPAVFFKTLATLVKYRIDHVINTQNICLSGILKAIYLAEKLLKKKISFELVVSELPTKKTTSFFTPINRLSPFYKQRLKLNSVHPYCEHGQDNPSFWQQLCGLKPEQITYSIFPIRSEFLLPENQAISRNACFDLILNFKSREFESIAHCYSQSHTPMRAENDKLHVSVTPETVVTTIMLGSRPLEKTLVNYAKAFIRGVTRGNLAFNHCIFLICSDRPSVTSPAFNRLKKTVLTHLPLMPNLAIVPLSFQPASTLAPLILRSDATITCSGGMTSIELMKVARGKIWIHSDQLFDTWESSLGREMPIWEIGNAEYLIKKRGAVVINPHSLASEYTGLVDHLCEIYQKTTKP